MFRGLDFGLSALAFVVYLWERYEERRDHRQRDLTETALAAAETMKGQARYYQDLSQELVDQVAELEEKVRLLETQP